MRLKQTFAGKLAQSPLFSKGRRLFEQNSRDWNMPLSKIDKLLTGAHLILEDYSRGLFPPKFEDQSKAYSGEVNYRVTLPGVDLEAIRQRESQKPFWFPGGTEKYLRGFLQLTRLLDQAHVTPPARLLELGCGTGWMAEFLAISGFDVTGTSLAPSDIQDAQLRLESLAVRRLGHKLRFELAPMEAVAETLGLRNYYDIVFVFEALHHAFDWRRAVQSSFDCLRPGGWFLICNEPNLLHTFISYRVAKLSNTHEIGFSRSEVTRHLKEVGFVPVKNFSNPFHFWVKSHWIAAQKPA